MSFPENKNLEIPITVTTGEVVEVRQMSDKGFEYVHDGSTVTASLQGSVSGRLWTDIQALSANAQGEVAAHYNLVRVNTTVIGVLGTNTRLTVSGKVL